MKDKITSLFPDKYCKECGEYLREGGDYTKINHDGPFCPDCLNDALELEQQDNSQFGVGA